ncbi:MAG: baseplate J/gp47 family protein [Methylococcaceae bacterium]
MTIQPPNLDDRTFADLVEEAKRLIRQQCPEWNDLSPGDPGIVLLEAFAFLTETMIFRLNRIPEKAYIEFLRLIGVKLTPPSAARVKLEFSVSKPQTHAIEIPSKTRITVANSASGSDAPVFTVAETAIIPAGSSSVQTYAYHCNYHEAERIGVGSGLPGLTLKVSRPPIIAPTTDKLSLIVGIEMSDDEQKTQSAAIKHNNKTYRIWREVANFTDLGRNKFVYTADRQAGTITFAPSLRNLDEDGLIQENPESMAEIPHANSEVCVWYRQGGGSQGNVSINTLTVMKDTISGVSVINPEPASGGRNSESLQNALNRGPQTLHSLSRAVTARDFELLAIQCSGAVNRAKASTQANLWTHATPGTVEISLVPEINVKSDQLHTITAEMLQALQIDSVRNQILDALESRRPLGTHCVVNWANYKKVSIKARVVIQREEDANHVKQRVLKELYSHICPVNLSLQTKLPWPFGQTLKAWDVYKIIGSEPAVLSVEAMQMIVDDVPEKRVKNICSDSFQPDTWYTGCDERVFRSTNNGYSWELMSSFENEKIEMIKSFPVKACSTIQHSGLLAVITQDAKKISSIHISKNCGQTWITVQKIQFPIEDFTWLDRDGLPFIILATENGIYEMNVEDGAVPIPLLIDSNFPKLGFRAIVVSASSEGKTFVAVASYDNKGIYLSSEGGQPNSFKNIGLAGELIEVLAVQHRGPHRYLWAGVGAPGSDGKGCFRWTLSDEPGNSNDWKSYFKNWKAGSCKSLTFNGSIVLAASYRLGVLRLDSDESNPAWETLNASECGLPLRDVGKLETVDVVSANENANIIMACGATGIYRSADVGLQYSKCSYKEFNDEVRIPSNWLLYSGVHEIEIISENETSRN